MRGSPIREVVRGCFVASSSALLLAGCAVFRGDRPATASTEEPAGDVEETAKKAGEIATQPVRDLGIDKVEIPPVLVRATEYPYAAEGTESCEQLAATVVELNQALGPDFQVANAEGEDKVGKVAEAGGKAIVNSLIPFRGVVRELTGAAAAKRRLDDAVDAGYARRGFLRGLQQAKGCPPAL